MFGKDVHLYPLLEFTSKRYHILVFLCLFYVTLYDVPTSFLVAGHGVMSLSFWLSDIAVCVPHLFTPHLSLPTQASSVSWLLYMVLP